jgi:hypothetical protein
MTSQELPAEDQVIHDTNVIFTCTTEDPEKKERVIQEHEWVFRATALLSDPERLRWRLHDYVFN